MSQTPGYHSLLVRQLAKTGGMVPGCEKLLDLVSAAYFEQDRVRSRSDHANRIMSVELEDTLARLELQNLRFRAALDNMNQGLCLFDANGEVAVCNRRFLDLYGFTADTSLAGTSLARLLDTAPALADYSQAQRQGLLAEHLITSHEYPGELVWPGHRTVTIHRSETAEGGFLLTISDVTAAKQASERIAYLARHDSLTDLPNRVLLRERLAEIVRNAQRGDSCAVIFVDLDRFKIVNDTLGHPIGDGLLVQVAKRLKALIRPHDVVARLGGDEFAIVLQHVGKQADIAKFAERLIRTVSRRFTVQGHRIGVGASLGISIQQVALLDPAEALRQADIALYAAKAGGRGVWRIYTEEMHAIAQSRIQLEADLRKALDRGEFFVEYQPQLDLKTRRLTAVEALLRWQSPERGLVMPDVFITACEEIGLINELGCFVLETAIRDACAWQDDTIVAVNLSPVQFRSGQLASHVARALAQSGLDAQRLELEVTESLMIEDTASVLGQIQEIKRLGCRISLDDFGTGYSSLSYIRQFPFDKIKIDKSFVRDLEHNHDNLAIIRAVSGLCESLSLKSAAEGVETAEQLEILHRKKIDSVQGYLIGKPMASYLVGALISATNGPERPASASGAESCQAGAGYSDRAAVEPASRARK